MAAQKPTPTITPAAALAVRRAGLLLFSGPDDLGSHWVRFVMAEKDIDGAVIEWVGPRERNEDLMVLNPAQSLPTLADREVVLYPARLIVEYLDERYPHPPLMPVEPAVRARLRLALHQLEHQLYPLAAAIAAGPASAAHKARRALTEQLLAGRNLFPARGHFLSSDFNYVDCAWAPLLWRLRALEIQLPAEADNIRRYAAKLFARPAFQRSLTAAERALAA